MLHSARALTTLSGVQRLRPEAMGGHQHKTEVHLTANRVLERRPALEKAEAEQRGQCFVIFKAETNVRLGT